MIEKVDTHTLRLRLVSVSAGGTETLHPPRPLSSDDTFDFGRCTADIDLRYRTAIISVAKIDQKPNQLTLILRL